MNGFELQITLEETMAQAYESLHRLRAEGIEKAKAAAEARAALKSQEVALKAHGYPATLISSIAKGSASVNDKILAADIAESNWECTREELLLRKREADIIREQISREWAESARVS